MGDALAAMIRHARAVRRLDPAAAWSSVNANYMPPSGASLVHPHLQSAHDACGLTGQRVLVEQSGAWQDGHGSSYWTALVEQEAGGPRWVGRTGRVAWLTPFAPTGFHEVWGVAGGAADLTELTEQDTVADLGQGLSQILAAYRAWNLASFNFALIGGGPQAREHGHQVLLKVAQPVQPGPGVPQRRHLLRAPLRRGADRPEPGGGGERRPGQILTRPLAEASSASFSR